MHLVALILKKASYTLQTKLTEVVGILLIEYM